MYLRAVHAEQDAERLHELIKEHPLGVLTTFVPDAEGAALQHTHIPWTLDVEGGRFGHGVLRGHLARANPHAKQLLSVQSSGEDEEESQTVGSTNVSVLFTHSLQSYVTPRYYVHSKPANGKVVPTYDYASVEVRGPLRVHGSGSAFLDKQIRDLTRDLEPRSLKDANTEHHDGKGHAGWNVSDAPASYIDVMKRAIVGIEIDIESIVGKFKMSQELDAEDRMGVVDGFTERGSEGDVRLAEMIRERGRK